MTLFQPLSLFFLSCLAHRILPAIAVVLFAIIGGITTAWAGWDEVRLEENSAWFEGVNAHSTEVLAFSSPIFRLAIDSRQSGELTSLELFDGLAWRQVIGADGQTFPATTLRLRGQKEPLQAGTARLQRKTVSEKSAELVYTVELLTANGEPSGLNLSYQYEIFPEGALFLRIGLTGWPIAPIVEGTVALELDKSAISAAKFRDDQLAKKITALPSARVAIGWEPERSYTNEIEALVESSQSILGESSFHRSPGKYCWQFASAVDPIHAVDEAANPSNTEAGADRHDVRKAPVLYYNRIALGMANSPYPTCRSTCIGERIYHWVNFLDLSPESWHPSDTELTKMANNGGTMVILHHEYLDQRGSNGNPAADYVLLRNDVELDRCISTAHQLGLRVGIYVRGIEPYAIDDARLRVMIKKGVDGFYIDWHGAHAIAFHESSNPPAAVLGDRHYSADGSVAPAREYFRYICRLRGLVGAKGFIIGHLGVFNSGVLANVGLDGFLAGEAASEWALFNSSDDAVYLGMMAGSVVMPWPEEAQKFSEPESNAKMAAWGFYPHLLMGMDKPKTGLFPRDPDADQFQGIAPYWHLLSKVKPRNCVRVFNLPADARIVARSDNEAVRVVIYQQTDKNLLVLAANLSDDQVSATISFEQEILPPAPRKWSQILSKAQDHRSRSPLPDGRSVSLSFDPWGFTGLSIHSQNPTSMTSSNPP